MHDEIDHTHTHNAVATFVVIGTYFMRTEHQSI